MHAEIIEYEYPIRYDDGQTILYRVRLMNEDGTIANTGQGFESLRDATTFAAGASMAITTLQRAEQSMEPNAPAQSPRTGPPPA